MILPSRRLILLLLIPAIALMAAPSLTMLYAAAIFDALLLAAVAVDWSWTVKPGQIHVTRQLPEHLSLGADNAVGWSLHNAGGTSVAFDITEDLPETMSSAELPLSRKLAAGARGDLLYSVRPTRRGRFEFGDIHLRYTSALGLLVRRKRVRMATAVKVYPNVSNLAKYELAARRHRLTELGLVAQRHRGRGSIYESLRDYVPGDEPADVAWKATARRSQLLTRVYETDRSQNIVIMIDCGRMMTTRVDELTRLDYAINASLLLTHVAVKQGDYIGMLAFSDQIESFMPQRKGHAALMQMNESLYRLEPRLREPSYERACRFLSAQHRKRSLIVIFTDVIDVEASSALLRYTARFARHHLPLCVTMRNLELEAMAHGCPNDPADCFPQAVALQMLDRRSAALATMRRSGVDVLDVSPHDMTPRLIQRYLDLKQRARL